MKLQVRRAGSRERWENFGTWPRLLWPRPISVPAGQDLRLTPLSPHDFGNKALERLAVDFAGFTDLASLDLDFCHGVKDAGLAHLAGLTNLTELSLGFTGVKDAGLAHLAGLTNLTELNLRNCKGVTDAGLAHLAGLTNLAYLGLNGTGVTDAGLVHLAGLTNLTGLGLTECAGVTSAGLAHLAGLTNLTVLGLSSCKGVTSAGLAHLAGLTNLTKLHLDFTGVTDAGFAHLAKLTNLQTLGLDCTSVTDAGVAALEKELPGCYISHQGPPVGLGGDYRQQAVNQILGSFARMTEVVGAAAQEAAKEGKLPQGEADELARHGRALTSELEASARGAGYTGPGLAPKPEGSNAAEAAPAAPPMAASSGPTVVWQPHGGGETQREKAHMTTAEDVRAIDDHSFRVTRRVQKQGDRVTLAVFLYPLMADLEECGGKFQFPIAQGDIAMRFYEEDQVLAADFLLPYGAQAEFMAMDIGAQVDLPGYLVHDCRGTMRYAIDGDEAEYVWTSTASAGEDLRRAWEMCQKDRTGFKPRK